MFDPPRARIVAAEVIRAEAAVKNNPPDLINVALEALVRASLELPGFSTLNEMAAQIRAEVNTAIFETIESRMSAHDATRLNALLEVVVASRKSQFDQLKQAAGRASWSAFRGQVAHLSWVDSLGGADKYRGIGAGEEDRGARRG
ncbi:MAG: hypothetical protein ACRDX8_06235, partial [Acidimicrobiales bacterium]